MASMNSNLYFEEEMHVITKSTNLRVYSCFIWITRQDCNTWFTSQVKNVCFTNDRDQILPNVHKIISKKCFKIPKG
jgi:hypothetical protein